MKILWFIPIIPTAALAKEGKNASGTGFWIHALADRLNNIPDIELAIAYRDSAPTKYDTYNGIHLFSIHNVYRKYINLCKPLAEYFDEKLLSDAHDVVINFKPDIIHVHGTESIFGLLKARKVIDTPLVISIQGLFSQGAKFSWGDKTLYSLLKLQSFRDILTAFSLLRLPSILRKRGRLEPLMLRSANGILGRSSWDRSFAWSIAPKTPYFHVDELMRSDFYPVKWDISECQRFRIFTSGRLTLAKGMHIFLEAISLLKKEFPSVSAYIGGGTENTCEFRYLKNLVNKLNISDNVHFTGWIPGDEIIEHLTLSHVYANSSFIENGCNGLQEAMLLGLPCVAPFTGGIATTLKHRETGLLYPRGDSFMLADRIRELFINDHLSKTLGNNASIKAHQRHDCNKIVSDLLNAYTKVINKGKHL